MAKKDAFLLVSLEEEKARKLAAVVGNDSCRIIINFLAEKESSTESEISSTLNLPISTVHYNMQLLQQSGLVDAEEFHYSKKGREILHYRLANKYIVIAPKSAEGIMPRLKKLLPAFLFIGASSLALQAFTTFSGGDIAAAEKMAITESAKSFAATAPSSEAATAATALNPALFIFIGGVLALSAYFVYESVRDRIK